jgi:O-antigen ligase
MKKSRRTNKNTQTLLARSAESSIARQLLGARKILLAVTLFILPILIYLENTEYGYTKSIFALVSISMIVILWFAEMLARKHYALKLTQLFWPGLTLIGVGALSLSSTLFTTNFSFGIQSLNLLFYFGFLYLILANTIESENDAKLLLGSLLAAALATSLYAISQYFGIMKGPAGVTAGREAVISFMGNRNYVAEYLAFLLAPTLLFFVGNRTGLINRTILIIVSVTLVTIFFALILINSAAIWLGLFVGTIFFNVAWGAIHILQKMSSDRRRRTGIIAAVVSLVLSGVFAFGVYDLVKHPDSQTTPTSIVFSTLWKLWQENSGDIRSWDWWIGYEMWKASPWIGQGLGNYKIKFLDYKAIFAETERGKPYDYYIRPAAQAHNEFVQLTAEMGIAGVLATLFVLGVLFGVSLRQAFRISLNRERLILLSTLAGVVVFLMDAFFAFPLHLPASSLALIFSLSLLQSKWLQRQTAIVSLSLRAMAPWAIVLSVGAGIVVVLAARDWVADTCLDRAQREMQRYTKTNKSQYLTSAQGLLEECSLHNDFQPAEAYFQLGSLYDRLARSLSESQEKKESYLDKSLAYYQKYLEIKPNEVTYLQIALLYRRQGTNAKKDGSTTDAQVAFANAQRVLQALLDKHPSEVLRLEARFAIDVLLPLAQTDGTQILPSLEKFIENHPEYAKGYLTRGEIFLGFVLNGHREYCQRSKDDFNKTLRLVEQEIREINSQINDPRGPQVPYELYMPLLLQEKELAERSLNNLSCSS